MSFKSVAPLLILVRGIPGSGKSFLSSRLVDKLGASDVAVIDPDTTIHGSKEYKVFCEQLIKDGVDEKFYPYRFLRAIAHKAIEDGKIILWNQAFTGFDGFNKTIINLTNYAKDLGQELSVVIVEVEVDPDMALSRIKQRHADGGHNVPEEKLNGFVEGYASFSDKYDNVIVLNGQQDVDSNAQVVLKVVQAKRI